MASASEELGNATILGGSINPLQVYMGQQAARERQKAEREKEAIKQRDKSVADDFKFNPDKPWDYFNGQINDELQQHLASMANLREKGVPESKLQLYRAAGEGRINSDIAKTLYQKSVFTDAHKQLDAAGDLYNQTEARKELNNIFYGTPSNPKHFSQINTDEIAPKVFDNPRLYNRDAVIKKFIDDLHPNVTDYLSSQTDAYGNPLSSTQIAEKLPYELVDEGNTKNFKLDASGNKIIKVNPTLLKSVEDNKMVNDIMNLDIKSKSYDPSKEPTLDEKYAWINEHLAGKDETKRDVKLHNIPRPTIAEQREANSSKWGINFGHNVEDLEARRDIVEKMASGTRPDVLAAIGNVVKGSSAEYVDGGKKIRVTYKANLADPNFDPNDLTKLKDAYIKNTYNKGKNEVTSDIDISTPEAKKRAEYALSEILDSQNSKTSIGADRFHRYKEAHEKNNPKPVLNKSIAEQMKEAANKK